MAGAAGPPAGSTARVRNLALAVGLAAFLAYLPALRNGYVNWDDDRFITENWAASRLTPGGLLWALTTFHEGNWMPVSWISHMADGSVWGPDPHGRHLTSVLLHAVNAALLVIALYRLTGDAAPSVLVAGLFALHPVNVESVAWLAERKNVLSGTFAMLVLVAYPWYVARPSAARYAAVAALFALGLMAKPMLVTLPFVLLLLDAWPLGRLSWKAVREKLPLFAMSAAAAVITVLAQKSGHAIVSLEALSFGRRLANAAAALCRYLGIAAWPVGLSAFYPMPGTPEEPALGPIVVAGAVALLAGVSLVCLRFRRRAPHLLVGWLWFLGTLVPVIGLVQIGSQALADRYAYLPFIGLFVAAVWSIPAARAWPPPHRRAIGAALLLVALGQATAARTRVWRDSEALWLSVLGASPRSRIAHTNYGAWLARQGRADEAAVHFREALAVDPGSVVMRTSFGVALTEAGRAAEAIPVLEEALALDPRDTRVRVELARALDADGRSGEAEEAALAALEGAPDDPSALLLSAKILAGRGRFDESLARSRAALDRLPGDPTALFNVAFALSGLGRRDEAIATYREALRIDSARASAHYNLANALADAGRTDEAILHYREAIGLDATNAEAQYNLALALLLKGDRVGARVATESALRIRSEYPEAWYNLGVLRFQGGDAEGGIEAFREAARQRPEYAEAYANLAAACEAVGRADEARAAGLTALSLARAAGNEALVRALEARLGPDAAAGGGTPPASTAR